MTEKQVNHNDTTPSSVPPAPTPFLLEAPEERSMINTVLVGIIVILGGLIAANGITKYFPNFGSGAPVAVLDSDLISAAGIHDLLQRAPSMTPEAVEVESKKRAETLQNALNDLRQRGYVVIDRSAALAWPSSADITDQTASDLSIPPEALQTVRDRRAEQQRMASTGGASWPLNPSAPAEKTISGANLD